MGLSYPRLARTAGSPAGSDACAAGPGAPPHPASAGIVVAPPAPSHRPPGTPACGPSAWSPSDRYGPPDAMTSERRCIFYRTRAMVEDPMSGSDLRPAKLLQAFRELGYEVDVVAGPAADRTPAISKVKREILAGVRYDFLYAEPPTTPTLLNEPHHFPTHPLLDYRFLSYCHSRGIPVVLFYCDVQWRLPGYPSRVGWPKYLVMLPFFHLDLLVYSRVVDALLVPDLGMVPQIPGRVSKRPTWASIPGFDPAETPPQREPSGAGKPLRLFYVGGVSPPVYDLTPLLRGWAYASS